MRPSCLGSNVRKMSIMSMKSSSVHWRYSWTDYPGLIPSSSESWLSWWEAGESVFSCRRRLSPWWRLSTSYSPPYIPFLKTMSTIKWKKWGNTGEVMVDRCNWWFQRRWMWPHPHRSNRYCSTSIYATVKPDNPWHEYKVNVSKVQSVHRLTNL